VAVGQVTSGAWGETLGACVGLAYVRHPDGEVLAPDLVRAGEYQVNVGGRLYPAAVSLRPPFDPAGDRIKGRYLSLTKRARAPSSAMSPAWLGLSPGLREEGSDSDAAPGSVFSIRDPINRTSRETVNAVNAAKSRLLSAGLKHWQPCLTGGVQAVYGGLSAYFTDPCGGSVPG
jgi:hypothetical protein